MKTELAAGGLRVSVNHGVCSGTGYCQEGMPALFAVADRRAWLRADFDLATADREAVEDTAATCPWFAITVEDAGLPGGETGQQDAERVPGLSTARRAIGGVRDEQRRLIDGRQQQVGHGVELLMREATTRFPAPSHRHGQRRQDRARGGQGTDRRGSSSSARAQALIGYRPQVSWRDW